jgi:hypothetical protein
LEYGSACERRGAEYPRRSEHIDHWGDLVVIDLEHPSLAGCEVETLAEALVSEADNGVVRGTYVGGSYRSSASVERYPAALSQYRPRPPSPIACRMCCPRGFRRNGAITGSFT